MPQNETGIYKNVAGINKELIMANRLGAKYNPARPELSIAELKNMLGQADGQMAEISAADAADKTASIARRTAFKSVALLLAPLNKHLKSYTISDEMQADISLLIAKFRGVRRNNDPLPEEAPPADGSTPPAGEGSPRRRNSVSQRSFDAYLEHFRKLIDIIRTIPGYNPNEADYSITGLEARYKSLQLVHQNAMTTDSKLTGLITERNEYFNRPVTGLVDIGNATRDYLLSIITSSTPDYKEILAVKFRKVKED